MKQNLPPPHKFTCARIVDHKTIDPKVNTLRWATVAAPSPQLNLHP